MLSKNLVHKKIIAIILLPVLVLACVVLGTLINNHKKTKILLIGLDGASWKIILPLVDQGKLPNIKHLIEDGCRGKLETLDPIESDIIWTTVITGKSPRFHGITGNAMIDSDTGKLTFPTSNLRKVKALWNILSANGKKVGVVNYRASWPAEKVNGFMISNRQGRNQSSTLPYAQPSLKSFCTRKMFKDFRRGLFSPPLRKDTAWVFEHDNFMANIAEYLYKHNTFDFFCLYLAGTDEMSHYYWKYLFPDHEDVSPEEIAKYKDIIPSYYAWCDNIIGNLLSAADSDTTVIIISDHGFKSIKQEDRPYVSLKLDVLLGAAGLSKFNYNSKEVKLLNTGPEDVLMFQKNLKIVGDLSRDEFIAVREKIKDALRNIKVKENNAYLFKALFDNRNGFALDINRASFHRAPECHVLIGKKEYRFLDFLSKDTASGAHDPDDGIIIIYGKNINKHSQIKGASVYDIAPTILYLLDLPVAEDMPGNILQSVFNLGLLKKKPLKYVNTYENLTVKVAREPIGLPEEDKIIKDRMRSLGYLK
jgi:predicted AlkP superfamily phosphohydrolase/phosphomutase